MKPLSINIIGDPGGAGYHALLEFLAKHTTTFYVVDQWRMNEASNPFLQAAMPHLIRKEETSRWPGTSLFGATALVRHYELNDCSLALIKSCSHGLYDWLFHRTPPLPEDLGFLRSDESVFFASISHERDAWLSLFPSDYEAFLKDDVCRLLNYEIARQE